MAGGTAKMTRERILHWLYVCLYVGAIVIVAKLVVDSALAKGVAWYDKAGLVVIGLAAFAILKRLNPDLRGLLTGKVSALADRKSSEIAANLFLTVLGIMASAVGLMAPRADKAIADMAADTKQILHAVAPPSDAVLMDHIKGIWGEDDCKVTYRYTFADGGLIVRSVKNAPRMDPSEWRGDHLHFEGSILSATTIKNDGGERKGGTVFFTYKSAAGFETLDRDDKIGGVVTPLTRC